MSFVSALPQMPPDALAALMREAPVVADAPAAQIRLDQALETLPDDSRAALAGLLARHPRPGCAAGVAEGSPFLLELIRFDPHRLLRALTTPRCSASRIWSLLYAGRAHRAG